MKARILALCSDLERCEEVVDKTQELSKRLSAGVTLIYVKEEGLFELPIYKGRDRNLDAAREYLEAILRQRGLDDWALLLYESDIADHALLEAEREGSFLIVTHQNEGIDSLIKKSKSALYVLGSASSHKPSKALYVPDVIGDWKPCLDMAKSIEPATSWDAYMDYQFFPTAEDAMVDPMLGAMTPEILIEESEIIKSTKERFEAFCEAEGIEGYFEIGEQGLVEDILDAIKRSKADLLVTALSDADTILAEGAKSLVESINIDLLICFWQQTLILDE